MKNVQQWCQGKPPLIRIVAKTVVFAPEDFVWGIDRLYRRDLPNVFPVPTDIKQWHACYDRGFHIFDCFLDMLFGDNQHILRGLKRRHETYLLFMLISPEDRRQAIVDALSAMTYSECMFQGACENQFWLRVERHLDDLLWPNPRDDKPILRIKQRLETAEFQFFVRVYTPCFAAYNVSPRTLLDLAKNPEPKIAIPALTKLLPLDPSLTGIHPFNELIHQFRHDPAHARDYHLISSALSDQRVPFPQLKSDKLNARGLATIAVLAKFLRFRFKIKELRKLEEAAARDQGVYRDGSDQRSDDVYRKPIEREVRELMRGFPSGTFKSGKLSQ